MARSTQQKDRPSNTPPRDDLSNQLDHAEVVSGRWLVKALLIVLAVASVALYLTVCLLFYQGQWQFTFFPPTAAQPSVACAAAVSGLPITDVRFDTTEEGLQRLDGWWIPSSPSAAPALSQFVILFCPDGHSDLTGNLDALQAFHTLGVNLFAFDYQGFGKSQVGHPSQQKAYANGIAALSYLTGLRHIPVDQIIVYGAGLGAAVAAQVAQKSPSIAGLVLQDPQPSLTAKVKREQHIRLLPMWLVFQDRFDISGILPTLAMPKLVLSTHDMGPDATGSAKVFQDAVFPKQQDLILGLSSQTVYSRPQWRAVVGNFVGGLANQPSVPRHSPRNLK